MWPFANTSFERNTEPVPDPTSNRGVEVALMPALGNYADTYIYDESLLGFRNSTVIEPSSDLGIKLSQVKTYLESQKAKIVTAASDEAFETEYQNMIDTLNQYEITGPVKLPPLRLPYLTCRSHFPLLFSGMMILPYFCVRSHVSSDGILT